MKKALVISGYLLVTTLCFGQSGQLKSIIYDFDGLDIGQTNLPDGDYKNFDLTYEISLNPINNSDVLVDRVLRTNLNWSSGSGEFGKGITRHIELDVISDYINFFCYNPLSNQDSAIVEIAITEDDNSNSIYESAFDDKWKKAVTIPRSTQWQLISLSLNGFTDVSAGGNGIFDAGYAVNAGKILTVSLTFKKKNLPINGSESYFIDMICFSEGALLTGTDILNLPLPNADDYCQLGCLAYKSPIDSVPVEVENLFSSINKLQYINVFMPYATTGATASNLPGNSLQKLINNGYTPIITWEMLYTSFPSTDSIQPRLNDITSGFFDTYIDTFADKIKLYTDTIYIRLFHEFDGNWYPWCISLNNQDPGLLAEAFRYIVDRFRERGVYNVKWIWSPNSSPSPNASYNWIIDAYPGNSYVDIVATSIYNHPAQGTPPWRSFRSLLAECYYYLTHYFPDKPFFICELACRERYNVEAGDSQTKAEWFCQMDKDLRSYFSKTRALIFFNRNKEHDWRINSSLAAQEAINDCIWENVYYLSLPLNTEQTIVQQSFNVFPNPFVDEIIIEDLLHQPQAYSIALYTVVGEEVTFNRTKRGVSIDRTLKPGVYILQLRTKEGFKNFKIIKTRV